MKNLKNELIERIQHSKKRYRRYLAILLVLSMVTVLGVDWGLHQNGISMTADYECGKEPHEHSDACYTATLICGQEETDGQQGHTHSDSCYDENGNLICGSEESAAVAAHHHTDDCYSIELTCGKEAHVHTAECLLGATFDETSADTSDTGDNTNLDGATDGNADAGSSFDAGASGADFSSGESGQALDSSADVETSTDWEKTLPEKLTGVWADDLALVAESQIGYHESTQNFKVDEATQTLKGYTRYGAWYGNEYGDWTTMFAAFCLKYADIPETSVPINSGCESWIVDLKEKELYQTKENYTPEKGDIVFLDIKDKDQKADRVGIIDQIVNNEDGTIKGFYAIVGDSSDAVEKIQYTIEDEAILGYLVLPEKPSEENPDATPAPDENTDGTDQNGEEPFADEENNGEDQEDGETTEDEEFSEEEETDLEDSEEPTIFTDGDTTTQMVETENYTVSVSYTAEAEIPDGAKLKAIEYGEETEEYIRACEEAGKTFDWLIDISFYLEDEEIEPNDSISISVVAKNETAAGEKDTITEITHFAETGIEVIQDKDVEVQTVEDGQTETSFELDSLSLVAGVTYHSATVVSNSSFTWNNDFLIYKVSGDYIYFLANSSGTPVTFKVALSDVGKENGSANESTVTSLDSTSYFKDNLTGTIIESNGSSYNGTLGWANLVWHHNGGNNPSGSLQNTTTTDNQYLKISNGSLTMSWWQDVGVEQGSDSKYTRIYEKQTTYYFLLPVTNTYYLVFDGSKFTGSTSSSGGDLTLALVGADKTGEDTGTVTPSAGQTAVYTGKIEDLPLGFYSITYDPSNNNKIMGLAGVSYTIYDSNGNKAGVVTTTDEKRVDLSSLNLSNGEYTMKMTSVPSGYICDDDTWSFVIKSNSKTLSLKSVSSNNLEGIIMVNPSGNLEMDKTASVSDYDNRVYKVDLTAKSDIVKASIKDLSVDFVVDQSNSMLFPSGLKEVGNYFSVKKTSYTYTGDDSKTHTGYKYTGTVDWQNNHLSTNKVYYLVTREDTSSDVYALWYDSKDKIWKYQDSSFYAKAYYGTTQSDKIKTNDYVIFPTLNDTTYNPGIKDASGNITTGVSGGNLKSDNNMAGSGFQTDQSKASDGATKTYMVYEAVDEYNRLHYLRQSLSDLLQMLGAMCPEAEVTLDCFTSSLKSCNTYTLGTTYDDGKTGLQKLLQLCEDITTDGGTRQDVILKHAYNTHHENNVKQNKYLVLITDGAPAVSNGAKDENGNAITTGSASDDAIQSGTVYQRINYWAQQIKNKGTKLATVGLAMQNVKEGSKSMRYIATNGPSTSATVTGDHGEWWFQPSNSSALMEILCEKIFNQIVNVAEVEPDYGTVVDYISDSFYPVDQSGNAVKNGARIDANGNVVTSGGIGTIKQAEDKSWYVEWDKAQTNGTVNGKESSFSGRVYLKAKEDFIGGNAINTNKKATLTLDSGGTYEYKKPTVNVHLLDMNDLETEVTVYKGDTINEDTSADTASPLGSVKYFYKNVEIQKIKNGTGDVLNKVGAGDGCKESSFTIPYATGVSDLSEDQWKTLKENGKVSLPYTYNDADGEVGYFTFELVKTGVNDSSGNDTSNWDAHKASVASQKDSNGNLIPVETYTLKITYTAYKLGEHDRPNQNWYNGIKDKTKTSDSERYYNGKGADNTWNSGAGQEVGGSDVAANATLAQGKGTVESTNIHKVYVIDGTIRVWKEIDDSLKSTTEDQTYTFTLYRRETTGSGETTTTTDTQVGDSISVTVEKNQTSSSATTGDGKNAFAEWTNLERGTYVVQESVGEDADYIVESIAIIKDSDGTTHCTRDNCSHTNCYSSASGTTSAIFVLGNDTNNNNVISKAKDSNGKEAMYTSYTESPNGVLGEAVIKNKKSSYSAEIPVKKVWIDGDGKETKGKHTNDTIYVALYKDDTLVTTTEAATSEGSGGSGSGSTAVTIAQVLELKSSNSWQGKFTIPLASKTDRPNDYSIREIKTVTEEAKAGFQKALLVGSDPAKYIYFDASNNVVSDGGYTTVNNNGYKVTYSTESGTWNITINGQTTAEIRTDGTLVVTNTASYELPKTGGFGTWMYTAGGFAVVCMGLMYGLFLRQKREQLRQRMRSK